MIDKLWSAATGLRQNPSRPSRRVFAKRLPRLENLESRNLLTVLPFGASELDTGEFMLGRVAVTPVLLESNGQLDANTENWTPALIQQALANVQTATEWWVELLAKQNSVHSLEFVIDPTYANSPVPTRYEPISRVSNDYYLWTEEFLNGVGFGSASTLERNMRAFNHAQRQKLNTDWAFTLFVVNSTADADGQFAPGGSFSRAFAFAGGLFLITPSTRPASTIAHEIGHMFWAKDEYAGGAAYFETRGYYNTENLNAVDNPAAGFVQQPSIMASGSLLDIAYTNRVSPVSTLAMIGWQDSDGDGIFDVLDVPLQLDGIGHYDSATSSYRFTGTAKVGTLPNRNSEGLRNDITLNRVSRIEYRIGNGPWTTISSPNQYEVTLDLTIPTPSHTQPIEIRAVDARTGIASNVFRGRFDRSDAVTAPGVNGFIWIDTNQSGLRDVSEAGLAGWTVQLLSAAGQPLNLRRSIEPDSMPDGVLTPGSVPGVNISAVGNDTDGRVGVFADSLSSTGSKTFRAYSRSIQSWSTTWSTSTRRLKVDFALPTSLVEIDAIGAVADAHARIEAYDTQGNLIDRFTTPKLSNGQVANLRVQSAASNIAYVLIGGHANTTVRLDNLRYGPETTTQTGARGQYSFPLVPAGNYLVRVAQPASYQPLTSTGNQQAVTFSGDRASDIDFAFRFSGNAWQNPQNVYDVNGVDGVTPLDVLLIINEINQNGSRELAVVGYLAPPFIDVNGDGLSTPLDALQVINYINNFGSGEGEGLLGAGSLGEEPSGDDEMPQIEEYWGLISPGIDLDLLARNRLGRA